MKSFVLITFLSSLMALSLGIPAPVPIIQHTSYPGAVMGTNPHTVNLQSGVPPLVVMPLQPTGASLDHVGIQEPQHPDVQHDAENAILHPAVQLAQQLHEMVTPLEQHLSHLMDMSHTSNEVYSHAVNPTQTQSGMVSPHPAMQASVSLEQHAANAFHPAGALPLHPAIQQQLHELATQELAHNIAIDPHPSAVAPPVFSETSIHELNNTHPAVFAAATAAVNGGAPANMAPTKPSPEEIQDTIVENKLLNNFDTFLRTLLDNVKVDKVVRWFIKAITEYVPGYVRSDADSNLPRIFDVTNTKISAIHHPLPSVIPQSVVPQSFVPQPVVQSSNPPMYPYGDAFAPEVYN